MVTGIESHTYLYNSYHCDMTTFLFELKFIYICFFPKTNLVLGI